jgi:toxin ParE1/3/4
VKLRILRHRKFKRDALEIYVYIGEHNLSAAERFLHSLDADLHKLADMPGMGPARDFSDKSLSGIRTWPVSGFRDYLIFYRASADRLEALRVIHGARDIERAFEQR